MQKLDKEYTYYDSVGCVYRVKNGVVEQYVGDGKWEETDRDIENDYSMDLRDTGKIETQEYLDLLIDEWDEEESEED